MSYCDKDQVFGGNSRSNLLPIVLDDVLSNVG